MKISLLIWITVLFLYNSAFAQPQFIQHKAIQSPQPSLGVILSDVESHMTAGHVYRDPDKSTWGHETIHGINSLLRNQYTTPETKRNGFYVLNDRAIIIDEPNHTLSQVRIHIPESLKRARYHDMMTTLYQTYLVDPTKPTGSIYLSNWEDRPLYIIDEWVAYNVGAKISIEQNRTDRLEGDILHMMQFNVYALALAKTSNSQDVQFKEFLKWNLERSMGIAAEAFQKKEMRYVNGYWTLVAHSQDAEGLRQFTREYLGKEWTKKTLGF